MKNDCGNDDPVGRLVRVGVAALIFVLAAQSTMGLILGAHFHSFGSPLDLDRNNGLPDLLSTAAIVAGAVAATFLARFDRRARWDAWLLAALLTVSAVEDLMQSEPRGHTLGGLFVAATAGIAALVVLVIGRRAPWPADACLFLGLILLAAAAEGAYDYDQILNVLGHSGERSDLADELGIVIKQGCELAGWSLLAIGLWAAAMAERGRSSQSVGPVPRHSAVTPSLPG